MKKLHTSLLSTAIVSTLLGISLGLSAVLDANAVREAAIGLEQVGIALIAAKAEAGRDIARCAHLRG